MNERIAATPGARTILLAYGRCSNGTAGLEAGPHRLVLPAVDDCIAILLGSRDEYLRQFSGCPGTYYYTRGWIEYIDDPYHEYLQMIPRYGEQKAREIAHLILANYRRVALVDTGTYELADCDEYLRTVCRVLRPAARGAARLAAPAREARRSGATRRRVHHGRAGRSARRAAVLGSIQGGRPCASASCRL